jgi:polyisoprenoid-binding protein YceI
MVSRERLKPLEIAALSFAIFAATLAIRAAVEPPAKPAQRGTAAQALPAPGTYEMDPPHAFAYFDARHEVVGLVRGRFDKVTGTITVTQNLAERSVDITIDTSSISTQNNVRDEDLRGPAYFDVKRFPTMTYHGRGIRRVSRSSWTMDGSLSIRGVTKVVPLTFNFKGTAPSQPGKPARVAFHGSAATKRDDFGMTRDDLEELGGSPAPGPDVEIEIDVEALAKIPIQ